MTCQACNDRGWIPNFPGDGHGELCLACTDLPESVLNGPPAPRRKGARKLLGTAKDPKHSSTVQGPAVASGASQLFYGRTIRSHRGRR